MGRNVQHHGTQWVAVRRSAAAFVLIMAVIAGCGQQQDPLIVVKPSVPLTSAGGPGNLPIEYPTQWLGSKTLTVAPGVHVLGELFPSAAYAIETKHGIILIDTGVDETGYALRDCMVAVGLRTKQIRYILITHAHYDHVSGANKLREVSSAVVCAGRDDCAVLRGPDMDALHSLFPRTAYSGAPIEVDRELDDGDVIELGDAKIRVISAPGHTPGSVCYLLEKDSQRILFSGDVIASLNFGPATYPVHISPRFRGDAESYLNTINLLLEMEPPDLLLPGHPNQQRRLQTIRMDQQKWNGLLRPAKTELQEVVSRHRQDGADFLDGAAKEIEPGLYYLGDLDGIATYCIVDSEQVVVINAPGGDRFAAYLSTQFESLGLPAKAPNLVLLTSDDEAYRSGLASFATTPRVVAPQSALESLRASGADAAAHDELEGIVTFPIEAIPQNETLCYSFFRGTKQVLLTPNVPRNITLVWTNRQNGRKVFSGLQPQQKDLLNELAASPAVARSYRESLQQLAELSPDIWLPAMPMTGQNANLYDDDWQIIIKENRRQADNFKTR